MEYRGGDKFEHHNQLDCWFRYIWWPLCSVPSNQDETEEEAGSSTMILGLIIIDFDPRNLGYVVGDGLFLGFIAWIPSQLIYNRIKKQK